MSVHRWLSLAGGLLALAACATCGQAAGASDALPGDAPLELPAIFGDGMVLQRGASTPVWGRARAGERVRVELLTERDLPLCAAESVADGSGNWRVELLDLAAGGPYRLEVRGEGARRRTLGDVLVGEVWLASGQSNMRMTASACDGFREARRGAELPEMRVFLEESLASPWPEWRGSGRWVRCSPETCGDFSGVLFWFGTELHAALGVPVGLVDASLGGSRIELWTSPEPQFASPQIARYVSERDAEYRSFDHDGFLASFLPQSEEWQRRADLALLRGEPPPERPRNRAEGRLRHGSIGYLFNGKILPLATYGLRGFLWYQGEDNVLHASHYGAQLELLVADWRAHWGRGDLPFCWVQLPGFADGRAEADWQRVREEMRRALCLPNTGMVVSIDVGLSQDIHPTNKAAIGHRLAGWALSEVYGAPRAWSSPLFTGHAVRGRRVSVSFAPTYGRLASPGGDPTGFELAGQDGRWHPARARVAGDGQRVVVECSDLPEPLDVRYGWNPDPTSELVNTAGLPATPFTTRL